MVSKRSDSFIPRLCGGVFLALLDAHKKSTTVKRKQFGAKGSGITFSDMLADLIKISNPAAAIPNINALRSPATNYRKCDISSSEHFPFSDESFVASFEKRLTAHYDDVLAEMRTFVYKYFDTENTYSVQNLVKGILEIILHDDSIRDADQFFYTGNQPIFRTSFCNQNEYDFAEFLLAVWFFILKNRPDNTVGKQTFLTWHTQANEHSPWKYNGKAGESITRQLTIRIVVPSEASGLNNHAQADVTGQESPLSPVWTQDMDRVRALWASVQGTKLEPFKKSDEIAASEQGYIYPLYAAYGEHLKRPVANKSDLTQQLQMDLEMRRQHFYEAETVRLQGEQALGGIIRGEFADLKEELLSCVWNTYMDDYDDGFKRMRQVMKEAGQANCVKGNLIKTGWIGSGEKQGIGHMLAAENKLIWVVNDNA